MSSPAPPGENVLVYHYPYENDDRQVKEALSRYGTIKNVAYQSWTNLEGVHTGTRIVKMDRREDIPRSAVTVVRSGIEARRLSAMSAGVPVM